MVYRNIMKNSINRADLKEVLLDFSQDEQISYWAARLGITPELMKSAVRACHNNGLERIVSYLQACSKLNKDLVVN